MDYLRFSRILDRCRDEIAAKPDCNPLVKRAHAERLDAKAEAFLASHRALGAAEKVAALEGTEARAALETIDQPYRQARSVARLNLTGASIPDPLKSLDTDTDKKTAIRALLDLLTEHRGEGWADDVLAGEFARLAPETIRELSEWIDASADLQKARRDRAAAFGPAYETYLRFKDVVRDTYGSSSQQYRRIHIRNDGRIAEDDPVVDPSKS